MAPSPTRLLPRRPGSSRRQPAAVALRSMGCCPPALRPDHVRRLPGSLGAAHLRRRGPRHPRGGTRHHRTPPPGLALIGQVKLAPLRRARRRHRDRPPSAPPFPRSAPPAPQLTLDVPQTTPATDPCALPDLSGYSGRDNRLYRFEIHRAGRSPHVRLKWSRDNASTMLAAALRPRRRPRFPGRHPARTPAISSRS